MVTFKYFSIFSNALFFDILTKSYVNKINKTNTNSFLFKKNVVIIITIVDTLVIINYYEFLYQWFIYRTLLSGLDAWLVRALLSGLCRAERHWFEPRSTLDFLLVPLRLVLYELALSVSSAISP